MAGGSPPIAVMRLNWFSPLPPAATGIAEYARTLLPSLCRQVDVTVWTDQETWSKDLAANCEIRRFSPDQVDWVRINRADLSVFNLGNNVDFHGGIWEVNRAHAGIVILHDLRLQDFFWGVYSRRPGGTKKYIELMEEVYGPAGAEAAGEISRGKVEPSSQCVRYPLTEAATKNAIGVITHTSNGFDALREHCPQAVGYLPLPYAAADANTFAAWSPRSHRSAPKPTAVPPFKIVVFGHIGPNRRVGSLLRSLSTMATKSKYRVEIHGLLWDEEQVRAEIARYQLAGQVTLHGYSPDLDDAIADADLAVNLRFPTMGEASLSQLQIWDHAIPSIVTRTGWYATLSEEAVLFVDPEHEEEDLSRHLKAFADDPAGFKTMGDTGRKILLRDHTPGQYIAALLNFAKRALSARGTLALLKAARGAGEMVGPWMRSGECMLHVAETVAAQTSQCTRLTPVEVGPSAPTE
jgi:glycosyltransferase involved in cell wall biosynthesis